MEDKTVRWLRPINKDSDGFVEMEGVLNTPPSDLSDRFCGVPFDYVEIHSGGRLFLCCPTWLPTQVGSLADSDLVDAFNSDTAQDVRRSILDGSYRHCHKLVCPHIQAGTLPRKTDIRDERHKRVIEQHQAPVLDPLELNLCYDDSCNLSCPSCRRELISVTSGPEYEERKSIQDKVIRFAFGEPHDRTISVTITGSGDPFGSKLFRELLFGLDGSRYPNANIRFHTNGVAFTPAVWNRLEKIHRNIDSVMVSVDAGSEAQYQITRRGGKWQTLLNNLEFLGNKRREGAFRSLRLHLVVQRDNFRGIPEFVRIGKRVGADRCYLSLLNDWATWTKDEFLARTVWNREHPQFEEFVRVMADPIVGDAIVDLGNTVEYRKEALTMFGIPAVVS